MSGKVLLSFPHSHSRELPEPIYPGRRHDVVLIEDAAYEPHGLSEGALLVVEYGSFYPGLWQAVELGEGVEFCELEFLTPTYVRARFILQPRTVECKLDDLNPLGSVVEQYPKGLNGPRWVFWREKASGRKPSAPSIEIK